MAVTNLTQDFSKVVESVFNSWTGLQLAIANDSGGHRTREKVANMIENITSLICEYDDVDSNEVADSLHQMMDDNFQTICEDNSPEEIGSVLCEYFSKYKSGEKEKVDAELGIVKKIYSSNCSLPLQKEEMGISMDEGGDSVITQVNSSDCDSQTMELDSEWTVVRSRRKV